MTTRSSSAKKAAGQHPRKSSGSREKSAPDAISLLEHDHMEIKQLLNQLTATTEGAVKKREALLERIETELNTHTRIEEEIFYPAFKESAKRTDDHLYYEAIEEHNMVESALSGLKSTDTETKEFSAKAKVLKDLVLHHAEEEEEQVMFVKARETMTSLELQKLAGEMQSRKEALQSDVITRAVKTTRGTLAKIIGGEERQAA
jgi:iron-sulfur cluster repair protein YtfE (RIC family)